MGTFKRSTVLSGSRAGHRARTRTLARLSVGGGPASASRAELPADGPITVILKPDRGDDWLFGVTAIAANGAESPVASAVPGGAYTPVN